MTPNELITQFPPSDAERAAFMLQDFAQISGDAPRSFLDMGAGSGSMSAVIALRFPGIRGVLVDVIARLTYLDLLTKEQRDGLESLNDPEDSRLSDRRFDLVCSMDVLEHIPDWQAALIALKRHVAPAGYLYIQAPSNYPSPNFPTRQVLKNGLAGLFNRHDPRTHVRHGLSVKRIVDAVSEEFDLLVASESYVVDGKTPCKFKPRTHVLARRRA